MIDTQKLSKILTDRFGLPITVTSKIVESGEQIRLVPSEHHQNVSFFVEFILGWRSIDAIFMPGTFASQLVKEISLASEDQKATFICFAKSLLDKRAILKLELNNTNTDIIDTSLWPDVWSSFSLSMSKRGLIIENGIARDFEEILPWITGFFGLSISLLPLEPNDDITIQGQAEGDPILSASKRYERKKINRAICIQIHGTACLICGLNFKDQYGIIGEGFIHVHHIIPLSTLGGSKVINPEIDLVPVCPNCHSMLHKRNPPYSVQELKDIRKLSC